MTTKENIIALNSAEAIAVVVAVIFVVVNKYCIPTLRTFRNLEIFSSLSYLLIRAASQGLPKYLNRYESQYEKGWFSKSNITPAEENKMQNRIDAACI